MTEQNPNINTEPPINFVDQKLRLAIQEKGEISFEEYMNICLYSRDEQTDNPLDSGQGYYSSGDVLIGNYYNKVDFITSPEISPIFGASTAEQIFKMWTDMGSPNNFNIVEMGAGNGTWAKDILAELKTTYPKAYDNISYTIVEYSPGLIDKQKQKLEGEKVNWVFGSASELPISNVKGVFISNELPDAFPVHRLANINGEMKEQYVTLNDDGEYEYTYRDIEDPEILKKVEGKELPPENYLRTVNLHASRWIEQVGNALDEGYVITIDYGEKFHGDTSSDIRIFGNLPGSLDNIIPNEKLFQLEPGSVDMTADVDFTDLEESGAKVGLKTVSYQNQYEFLINNSFQERVNKRLKELRSINDRHLTSEEYDEMYSIKALMDPKVPPSTFKVLIQKK